MDFSCRPLQGWDPQIEGWLEVYYSWVEGEYTKSYFDVLSFVYGELTDQASNITIWYVFHWQKP